MNKPRMTGLPETYRRCRQCPVPVLVVLLLAIIAAAVIAISSLYVVRSEGGHHPRHGRVGTSHPAPTSNLIPPANETGFQTGDKG